MNAWMALGEQAARLLIAFPGGVVLSNLLAAALAIGLARLGMLQSEAVVLALLLCYALWPCWLLWIYCTRRLGGLLYKAITLGALCALIIQTSNGGLAS